MAYGEVKDADGKKAQTKATKDQRGTKEQPLVVEGIPAQKTEAESREEREHRTEQASIGASVRDSLKVVAHESVLTTILTGLLFTTALVQAGLFLWQLCDLRHATRAAAATARAARRSALANERAVNASMTIESAALTIDVQEAGLNNPLPPPNPPGIRPAVNYAIKNFGRSSATVIRFQDRLRWTAQLPIPADFDGEALEDRPERNVVILPERNQLPIGCSLSQNVPEAEWNNPGPLRMHLVTRIEYQDVFGKVFVQGFAVRITRHPTQPEIVVEVAGGSAYNYKNEKKK